MGIKQLSKLLADLAPGCIKEQTLDAYMGRIVAIDASMYIYQFLVAIRHTGAGGAESVLTNAEGNVTSHIQGMLHRTIRIMKSGIKPVFVFDGKAPDLKMGELKKRKELKAAAVEKMKQAQKEGDTETANRMGRQTTRMTQDHIQECMSLLKLMGVPVVAAPGEAEAQCAELCKGGKCWAIVTEDMDALTFGSPRLLRRMMAPESKKLPILEFNHSKMLEELKMSRDEFIDLCILCGCDYTQTIRGIGPKKAFEGITKHRSIEKFVESLDSKKYTVPGIFPYVEARKLFKQPLVTPASQFNFKWTNPDEEGLLKYMVETHGFNEDRMKAAITRWVDTL
mgnify:CR=1 FL=1